MSKLILSTLILISTSFFIVGCSKNKAELKKEYSRSSTNIQKEKDAFHDLNNELKK